MEYIEVLSEIIGKMLLINSKEAKHIDIPEGMTHRVLDILTSLLLTIDKDGSKSI